MSISNNNKKNPNTTLKLTLATSKPTTQATTKPKTTSPGNPTMKSTGKPTMKSTGKPTMKTTGKPTMKSTGKPTTKSKGKATPKTVPAKSKPRPIEKSLDEQLSRRRQMIQFLFLCQKFAVDSFLHQNTLPIEIFKHILSFIHPLHLNRDLLTQESGTFLKACGGQGTTGIDESLKKGVDVNVRTSMGSSGLIFAVMYQKVEITHHLLLNGALPDLKSGLVQKKTALLLACEKDSLECAKLLIQHGADVNCSDESQTTPLQIALEKNSSLLFILLLENGADPNQIGKDDLTPLMTCAMNGLHQIIPLLCRHGAKINLQNSTGKTALMIACQNNHLRSASELLRQGVDMNIQDKKGFSALMMASQKGSKHFVELLLENGADVNLTSKQKDYFIFAKKAEDYAKTSEIVDMLRNVRPRKN